MKLIMLNGNRQQQAKVRDNEVGEAITNRETWELPDQSAMIAQFGSLDAIFGSWPEPKFVMRRKESRLLISNDLGSKTMERCSYSRSHLTFNSTSPDGTDTFCDAYSCNLRGSRACPTSDDWRWHQKLPIRARRIGIGPVVLSWCLECVDVSFLGLIGHGSAG